MILPLLNKQQERLYRALQDVIKDHTAAESVGDGVSLGDVVAVLNVMDEELQEHAARLCERRVDEQWRADHPEDEDGEGWKGGPR